MLGKFMDFCFDLDRKQPGLGLAVFISGLTFTIIFGSLVIVGVGYKPTGAGERHEQRMVECREKQGKLIYVKGTGDVCITGVIELQGKS